MYRNRYSYYGINIVIYTSLSEEFRSELRTAFHKFARGTFVFTGRPHVPPTSILLREISTAHDPN